MSAPSLRLRKKPFTEVVQQFDAFAKVQDAVREEKKLTGGAISLVCFIFIGWLVVGEFTYYSSTQLDYRFRVDTEFDKKLQIDLDIVVAMPCSSIGADVMDATDQPLLFTENKLRLTPVDFELNDMQRKYWDVIRQLNRKQKPGKFTSLDNLLMVSTDFLYDGPENKDEDTENAADENGGIINLGIIQIGAFPGQREKRDAKPKKNACRVHGFVRVNKVSGNFHITPGKSLPIIGGGHLHISQFGGPAHNFSHRIQKLSFGPRVAGMMNPLDGVEQTANNHLHLYQYYAQVVPTKIHFQFEPAVDTCQYSITQRHRSIDHSQGSHGMPGIFIKYDMAALTVDVYETHRSYVDFMVRLCAIVGGIFATSGIINAIIGFVVNCICCRLAKTHKQQPDVTQNGLDVQHDASNSNHKFGQTFVT